MKAVLITLFSCFFAAQAATVNIPPNANIQAIVDANPAGTTFQLAAGVYIRQTVVARDGDQFIGAMDELGNRLTTLSGAQPLTSFTRDEFGNYVADTTQTQPGQRIGWCAKDYPRCTLPEDFFYDDEPYFHNGVGGAALGPGQFYFDYPAGKIYFRPRNPNDDPNQHKLDYSRTRSAIVGTVSNVTVKNLIVEKYAVPAQFGAIGDQYPGPGWIIQNNETRFNHGMGMRVSANGQLLGNYTHHNGQMGMGGDGNNILVQDNEIAYNNYTKADHDFECGGFKFAKVDGLIVRHNYSHDNEGPGMWTDISAIHVLYEDNLVINNHRAGIFHETSYDAVIRNNMILFNGAMAPDDWFWNAQVQIAGSQNVEVYDNIVLVNSENNGNGIMLIQQDRRNEPCTYGPCRVINNFVHDNFVITVGNRWHGTSGAVQDYWDQGDIFAPSSNNRFDRNHYYVSDVDSYAYWHWNEVYRNFDEFRADGQDASGTAIPSMSPALRNFSAKEK